MARPRSPHPTDRELQLLQILWRRGPSTVRAIVDELPARRRTGYTSVLKILQIMTEKGLVLRDESERSHVYSAARPESTTQQEIVGDILDRVFHGSAMELVARALAARPASRGERQKILALLEGLEEETPASDEENRERA